LTSEEAEEGEQEEADEEEGETVVREEEEEGRDSGSLHPNAVISLSLCLLSLPHSISLSQFLSLRLVAAHTDIPVMSRRLTALNHMPHSLNLYIFYIEKTAERTNRVTEKSLT